MISQLVLESVCLEDRDSISDDKEGVMLQCFNKWCVKKRIIVTKEFKTKDVTCPHCNSKYKVRCFKNGSANMRVSK